MSRPWPRGEVGGSGWGVSMSRARGSLGSLAGGPGPHLGGPGPHPAGVQAQAQAQGSVSQHALSQTDGRWLLLQAVRIPLECILINVFLQIKIPSDEL